MILFRQWLLLGISVSWQQASETLPFPKALNLEWSLPTALRFETIHFFPQTAFKIYLYCIKLSSSICQVENA